MRAITYHQYGGPEQLRLEEVSKPAPKANEVLVRVKASSVNPKDWRLLRADPPFIRLETGLMRPRNTILGSDVAGVVEAVGQQVIGLKPGDEVFGELTGGCFAEYVCADESSMAIMPGGLPFEVAAAVPLAGLTALQSLMDHGQLSPGEHILINGAGGGVGSLAVKLAKALGSEVTAVCSASKAPVVKSWGASFCIDYHVEDFSQNSKRYDMILDVVGNLSIKQIRRSLKPKGRAVVVGYTTFGRMLKTSLLGSLPGFGGRQKIGMMNAKAKRQDLSYLAELMQDGRLVPHVSQKYSMLESPKAITRLEKGGVTGKLVIIL